MRQGVQSMARAGVRAAPAVNAAAASASRTFVQNTNQAAIQQYKNMPKQEGDVSMPVIAGVGAAAAVGIAAFLLGADNCRFLLFVLRGPSLGWVRLQPTSPHDSHCIQIRTVKFQVPQATTTRSNLQRPRSRPKISKSPNS